MLKAGFVLLTVILAVILYVCAGRVANKAFTEIGAQRNFKIRSVLVFTGWLVYISALSLSGFFTVASFPPRIPLLLVLPTFLFFIYLFTNRNFKKVIAATPVALPVYVQSFRIFVELLILLMFLWGVLPRAATFEGYNFDILIGITAPFIALLATKNGSKKILLAWNFAGLATLAVIVFILLSYSYFPSLWGQVAGTQQIIIGVFPFTFLAGFLMPLAVFLHIFSIIKLKGSMN